MLQMTNYLTPSGKDIKSKTKVGDSISSIVHSGPNESADFNGGE